MNKITYGIKKVNGYHYKLVVCYETKQYEQGYFCNNSSFIDVWVKKKEMDLIKNELIKNGFTKTEKYFGNN